MAQYRSQWTGEVIDDAVGKAKHIEYVIAGVDAQAAFEKVDAAYGIAPVYAVYTTFENFSEISCRCVERETPGGQIVYRFEGIDSQQKQWRWTLTKNEFSSEASYAWNGPFTTQLAGHESTSKAVALYENSQTATQNIAKGQYVIWSSRLYTADSDITAGTVLRSAGANKNLTAVPNGGLNDLKSAIMHDLANIVATGTTNTTGAVIASGTYFYLNGTLVQAIADIAVNATFTLNTNYKLVTAGGLNAIPKGITSPGTYDLGYVQASGYITGSGNYFDFTVPVTIGGGLKIQSAKFKDNVDAPLYLISGRQLLTSGASLTIMTQNYGLLVLEYHFGTTQTPNTFGIVTAPLVITVV